jgi:integrase
MAGGLLMSAPGSMAAKVDSYIQQRRALGWQLTVEARELARFAAYADNIGHQGPLTVELALGWARLADNRSRLYQARRLETVGTFARHMAAFEPGTAILSRGLLGPAHQRVRPYIYSDREIIRLMEKASRLPFLDGLRALTYRTLIGLLASTGLRVCEALRLDRGDLDADAGILTVRDTKFHKSRLVPLHGSVTAALAGFASERDRIIPHPTCPRFFLSIRGRPLLHSVVQYTFAKLRKNVAFEGTGRLPPRLYDLRHTFATRRLLEWYRDDTDIGNAIAWLSVYLGHVKPSDTYWYLTGTPELLAVAAGRFEALFCAGGPGGLP